jgi:uncharacterized protein (UPF0332 family)
MSSKQKFSEDARIVLSLYRLHRAKGTLFEADVMISLKRYNTALECLYNACYYAIIALLRKYSIAAQTHQEITYMFALHFISTGKIPEHHFATYSRLYSDYLSSEHNKHVEYDAEEISILRPQAEAFVRVIEDDFINSNYPTLSFK